MEMPKDLFVDHTRLNRAGNLKLHTNRHLSLTVAEGGKQVVHFAVIQQKRSWFLGEKVVGSNCDTAGLLPHLTDLCWLKGRLLENNLRHYFINERS